MIEFFVEFSIFLFEDEINVQFTFAILTYKLSTPALKAVSDDGVADLFWDGPSPSQRILFIFFEANSEPVRDVEEIPFVFQKLEIGLTL